MTEQAAISAERNELNVLLEKGMYITVPRQSIFKRFGKPERRFTIRQPYLGTLDRISHETIQMDFSEERLKADPFGESKHLAFTNAKRAARVVAIAILNSKWPIKLFSSLLASYLLWRVTPQKLLQMTVLIQQLSNLGDFTISTRYLAIRKTTTPNLVEKKAGEVDPNDQNDLEALD